MPLTSTFGDASRDLTVSAFPALAARNSASVSGVRVARLAALHPKIMNNTENTMLRYPMRFITISWIGSSIRIVLFLKVAMIHHDAVVLNDFDSGFCECFGCG